MVSRVGWNLNSRRLISGFGVRRRRTVTRGRGVVRRAVGAIARPALGFIANKIADMISGGRIVRSPTFWRILPFNWYGSQTSPLHFIQTPRA